MKGVDYKAQKHIDNLEEFFKSRLAYVIENTLKHIELNDFLDHIVKHDENIIFEELREMIISIFNEIKGECVVLQNANRSAQKQIVSTFANFGYEYSLGILFRYRQCNVCNKYLDEAVKSQSKAK